MTDRWHCPECGEDYVDKINDPDMIAPATLSCINGHIWTNTPAEPGGIEQIFGMFGDLTP